MESNVTKMSFKGFRLGYSAKHILMQQKAAEMQGNLTTGSSIALFTKWIQKHNHTHYDNHNHNNHNDHNDQNKQNKGA